MSQAPSDLSQPAPGTAATAPGPAFLDVPALLESSQPRPAAPRFWLMVGGFAAVVLASALLTTAGPQMRNLVRLLSLAVMIGLMGGLSLLTMWMVRRFKAEQQAVEGIGELVQLRRWTEAAALLDQYLSRPSRSPQLRGHALLYLASVLARYHRFEDAVAVYDHLLDHENIDPGTAWGLRLGRAMALLGEEHLHDADRAISELRRMAPPDRESGGLALVELYRDVKTGHAQDAVDRFARSLPAMREQLGHRVADAYALAARAYDLLGRTAEAQDAFAKATLLSPPPELYRRYKEVEKLQDRYDPAVAPPEAA